VSIAWEVDSASIGWVGLQQSHHYLLYGQNSNAGMTTTPRMCKVGSAFWFTWNESRAGASPTNHGFGVDRWRDPDGTPNTDGISIILCGSSDTRSVIDWNTGGGNANGQFEVLPRVNGNMGGPHASNRIPYAAPNHSSSWARGGNVGVAPLVPWYGGPLPSPICAVVGSPTDFPTAGTTTAVDIYGVTRTYRQSGLTPDNGPFGRILQLWE